jgi:uncharacterized membrane protein YbhN (UPF0104 family)
VAGDLWNWVAGVFARIGDVSIYWLVLALALKTAESALIGLTWRNAIFRDWGRYAREVALPSGASFGCRIGVNVVFMAAFGIPITAFTVFLVASSHMLSQLFSITPGGVGQTQALDVATLRRYASTNDVAAFSVTQDAVITLWNVVLGVTVMLWAFGFSQMKELLSKSRKHAQEQPGV